MCEENIKSDIKKTTWAFQIRKTGLKFWLIILKFKW